MKNLDFDRKGLINKCPRCKAKISPGYRFCSSCGYRFIKTEQSLRTKSEKKEEKIDKPIMIIYHQCLLFQI
ncbi:hypothetical protein LCGC14_1662920 [marine sediment metagenome]|uniref:Putative zinc-ribbon domain-containing protein n=1 Tax=marine sediment metagenome TaxID=412755 RepID=A0A0F9KTM0_9ZZZZ